MIAFVQTFGLQDSSGGARVLRAMLGEGQADIVSVNTGRDVPPWVHIKEIHLPLRPRLGRLEQSRFHHRVTALDHFFRGNFESRLRRLLEQHHVQLIHTIPHSYEIVPISRVAITMNLPLFLSVHDDIEYSVRGHRYLNEVREGIANAWRNATGIFAISEELGLEYCRRYGTREFSMVTDGLTNVAGGPQRWPAKSLRIYFMGLFHYTYGPNLRALMDALKIVRNRHSDWAISVTCRSRSVSSPIHADDVPVQILPFAPETEVEKDMLSADLLYQPLPFAEFAQNFVKFSLSTKMITYLGSGLPIFYHGPEDSAASKLLSRHQAAAICTTLDPLRIADELEAVAVRRESIVRNALSLASSRFMLADQQRRFWDPIFKTLQPLQ